MGAYRRPLSQSKVVSSGATSPARPPASIVMLQTVMRASIGSARIASPAYSTTCPAAPSAPMRAITARIRSLAPTCGPRRPSTVIRSVRGRFCQRVWVASTWLTSEAPIPKASAPNAPWVEVWLSPHTRVTPGWVKPSSGATT